MRILIVGAGIGGLALAQALFREGIDVAVFDRDETPSFGRQGYRVTFHPPGLAWMERCLPAERYAAFLASSGPLDRGLSIVDEQLRPAFAPPPRGADDAVPRSIDRLTLRRLLLQGIEDRVHFDRAFTGYAEEDGAIVARFADGGEERGDLLVGAEGTRSQVRRQLLPEHAELFDTGMRDLAGKLPYNEANRAAFSHLASGSITVVAQRGGATMVIIPQEFGGLAGVTASDVMPDDYLYWGLLSPAERFAAAGPEGAMDAEKLRDIARGLVRVWDPAVDAMVAATPADDIALLAFRTSVPHPVWPTRRATLIGDAVHSMVPMRGQGANTAVHDAAELADRLVEVARNGRDLIEAVGAYEAAMVDYGFAAVRESHATLELLTGPPGAAPAGATPF